VSHLPTPGLPDQVRTVGGAGPAASHPLSPVSPSSRVVVAQGYRLKRASTAGTLLRDAALNGGMAPFGSYPGELPAKVNRRNLPPRVSRDRTLISRTTSDWGTRRSREGANFAPSPCRAPQGSHIWPTAQWGGLPGPPGTDQRSWARTPARTAQKSPDLGGRIRERYRLRSRP
jgi:hypothetical protein